MLAAQPAVFYQHVGLYAYRRDFLLRLAAMPQSPLSCAGYAVPVSPQVILLASLRAAPRVDHGRGHDS